MPGFINYWNGDFDKASAHFEKAKVLFPESFLLTFLQALLLAGNGEIERSCSIFRDLSESAPATFAILFIKYNAALKGNISELNKTDSPKFQEWAWRDFQYCYFTAQIYTIANDKKEALKWLEHAVEIGMVNYPFISEKDPLLENIRSEPGFRKLIERVKHEWEDFEV